MPLPLVVHLAAGELRDVPDDDGWLSDLERDVVGRLKLEKRRKDWRLGRWLARRALQQALAAAGEAPATAGVSVIAADDGAPEVLGPDQPITLSISHRQGRGLAAAALGSEAIGCDLELVEERSERFIRDWLTSNESAHVLAAPDELRHLLANLAWSAKESASKVLRVGLRFDTRAFEVALPDASAAEHGALTGEWLPITVRCARAGQLHGGFWRAHEHFVETILAATPFEPRDVESR